MLSFHFFMLLSGLSLAAIAVYLFTSAIFTNNNDAEALAWASGNEPVKSKSVLINISRPLIHNFAIHHARRIKSASYRKNVARKILTAGLSAELNVDEFIGLQIFWGLMFPFFFCIMDLALQLNLPYVTALGISMVGILFPHMYCSREKSAATLPWFAICRFLST
jgi:tight adherence protein C